MRTFLSFFLLFSLNTCKTVDKTSSLNLNNEVISECPEDGTCYFSIHENSQLVVKKDEFGHLYPEVVKGDFIVLKFEFKRSELQNTIDSGYSEEILLQLKPNSLETELYDNDLSQANLLFGRLCFCRGQTGYYRITTGSLSVKKAGNKTYKLQLNFESNTVPQVIKQIKEEFSIN